MSVTETSLSETVLVVDDERPIADIIKYNLTQAGYQVMLSYDGADALEKIESYQPDLVILDIMLPKMDGFQVCRQIRNQSNIPILMLTAKDQEDDKIQGLQFGADDYVTKPFSPKEVVARVKALFRRVRQTRTHDRERVIQCRGGLEIDVEGREAYREGEPLGLTQREFELLKYLSLRSGRVFSRENLLEDVWGYEHYGDIRTVDVTVRRLREKIELDASNPRYLLTRRGAGYLFEPEPD